MFQIFDNKGFRMTLPNGIVCSVMFGSGNYCDNNFMRWNEVRENLSCQDAEIAFFNEDKEGNKTNWRTKEVMKKMRRSAFDDIVGRVNSGDVLNMMLVASTLNSEPTLDLEEEVF